MARMKESHVDRRIGRGSVGLLIALIAVAVGVANPDLGLVSVLGAGIAVYGLFNLLVAAVTIGILEAEETRSSRDV